MLRGCNFPIVHGLASFVKLDDWTHRPAFVGTRHDPVYPGHDNGTANREELQQSSHLGVARRYTWRDWESPHAGCSTEADSRFPQRSRSNTDAVR